MLGALVLAMARPAEAVRPFVTDDARIADYGQIEGETWFDFLPEGGRVLPVYNFLLNVVPLDWLEFGASGGIGWDTDDSVTILNPGVQAKLLFARPLDMGPPGLSALGGVTFPVGRGSQYQRAWGGYAIAPLTMSLLDGWWLIHGNLGWVGGRPTDDAPSRHRFFWALGTEVALGHEDWRFVLEAFAGEPLDPFGARLAGQTGLRWLASDYLNLDLAVTLSEELDEQLSRTGGVDWSIQLGLRFLIDAFTRGGAPGDTEGACGMIRWRPAASSPGHRSASAMSPGGRRYYR